MPELAVVPSTPSAQHIPLAIERLRDDLAAATDFAEVKAIADKGLAIVALGRIVKAGRDIENAAIAVVIRAERRLGTMLDELPGTPPGERGQGRRKAGAESTSQREVDSPRAKAVAAMGLTSVDVTRCRKLAAVPDEVAERHIASTTKRGDKLTRANTIAAVSLGADYDSDSWTTPPEIVEAIRRVLGEIDLDPASNDKSQRVVKAKKYYTLADDGIARTWKGRVFLNPPYAQPACGRFVEKFIAEHAAGRMTKGIILLNASTDTAWWHSLARRYPVCFTIGRIGFLQPDGTKVDANRVGQAFFAAGCGREFSTVFEAGDNPIGTVLSR
jgi:phage N-6-adenine-methyltransferase